MTPEEAAYALKMLAAALDRHGDPGLSDYIEALRKVATGRNPMGLANLKLVEPEEHDVYAMSRAAAYKAMAMAEGAEFLGTYQNAPGGQPASHRAVFDLWLLQLGRVARLDARTLSPYVDAWKRHERFARDYALKHELDMKTAPGGLHVTMEHPH